MNIKKLDVVSFLKDKSNGFWLGTDRSGLMHCTIKINQELLSASIENQEHFIHNDLTIESLVNDLVYSLYEDENGFIWVGTANGVSIYIPQKNLFDVYHLNKNNDLANSSVSLCFYDSVYTWLATDNTIWLVQGESSAKLFCTFNKSFEISSLFRTQNSDLLVAIPTQGLFRIEKNKIQNFISGNIKQPSPERMKLPAQLSNASIFSITGYNEQALLLAGYSHLGILENTDFHDFISSSDVNNTYIFRCVTENDSVIYAGADNGLFIANKKSKSLLLLQPQSGKLSADRINRMLLMQNELWIGTISGLNVYNMKNHSIKNYFTTDGLPDNNITSLASDKEGNLWIATRNGLCRFNLTDSIFSSFYENDGLNSNQLNSLSFKDSVLFVAADKGVNTIIPSLLKKPAAKKNVKISDFKIAGKSLFSDPLTEKGKALKQQQPVEVNWNENNISIQFTTLEYINPDAVKYAFMLQGFDKSWIYNGNNTTANYTNLPGGKYIFKIKYAGNDGLWRESNIAIPVHVSTAWFRAWWFYLICAASATILIYAFYRVKLNRVIEMQNIRNKIARDLHDDIGSTLSTIKILSGAAEKKINTDILQAGKMLHKITESSEKMMDAMSDIVWSINPNNDRLDNMAVRMREYAAKALEPKNIAYKIITDDKAAIIKLPAEKRRDIYLIFKEAVNNIAKYADATETFVILTVKDNLLDLVIRDNGKGFDTSATYAGNGLKNMQHRTKNIGGNYYADSKAGEGTTVHLTVPIT